MPFKFPEPTEEEKAERLKRRELKAIKENCEKVIRTESSTKQIAKETFQSWLNYSEGELTENRIVRLNELAWFAAEVFTSTVNERKAALPVLEDTEHDDY